MLDVLLVDDEPTIRLSVGDALRAAGHRVTLASDGAEAMAAIETKVFDVVVSDMRLPRVDGMTLFRALRADAPGTDVILITAFGDVQDAVAAMKEGAADYLLKPFDEARFRHALDRARDRARKGRVEVEALLDALRPPARHLERFLVRAGGRIRVVNADDVDWLEAADNYVRLHTAGQRHTVRETLRHLESRLDPGRFVRIHRSAMVRIAAIEELRPLPSGDYTVLLKSGMALTLSRSYRDAFEARVGRWS